MKKRWDRHGAPAAAAVAAAGEWTTVMLRNLPNKYTANMLIELLNNQGFSGMYDYVYLPIDFRNQCNLGYAFVNFQRDCNAQDCKHKLLNFSDWTFKSGKCLETRYAFVQGFKSNVERYRKSYISSQDVPENCKPLVFDANGHRVDITVILAEQAKYPQEARWQTTAPTHKFVATGAAAAWGETTDEAWNSWDSWEGGGKPQAVEARPTGWYESPATVATETKWKAHEEWKAASKDGWHWSEAGAADDDAATAAWEATEKDAWQETNEGDTTEDDDGAKKPGDAWKQPDVPAAIARYHCPFCSLKFAKWSACAGHFSKEASCRLQVKDAGLQVEAMQERCRLQKGQANIAEYFAGLEETSRELAPSGLCQ